MQRVLVIGSGGAGKSTLAARMAEQIGLPLIHLDQQYWKPGWVEPSKSEWSATIDRLLTKERWVMDGNYGGTLFRRMEACDTVIFLDLPRRICLSRVIARWRRHRGRSRPAMSEGCPERFSWKFLWWIWTYPTQRKPGILEQLAQLRPDQRAIVLSSQAEIESFLRSIAATRTN
jgi:adenylate kinase family enzyme